MHSFFLQAELSKKYEDEQLPASLEKLEKILGSNKGGNGFFVGDAVNITFYNIDLLQFLFG